MSEKLPQGPPKKPGPPPLPENWGSLSGDEKFNYFTSNWASTKNKPFVSEEVAEKYGKSAQRWLDVLALKEPDIVPALSMFSGYIHEHAGVKPAAAFYDPAKATESQHKFHSDFDCDYLAGILPLPGRPLDTLGCKLMKWPGGTLPESMQFQYTEDEFMRADEYDELIANPEGYMLRKYLPRIFEGLSGLQNLPTPFHLVEGTGVTPFFAPFAGGPLREAIDSILKAADETMAHLGPLIGSAMKATVTKGLPGIIQASTYAPYDIIGDTMRCTTPMMMDMFRRPEKIRAACDALVPYSIRMGIEAAMASRTPFVLIPLHKGADGFMSRDQFLDFYWPSFKAQLLGLIDAGLTPLPFVEGSYDQRVDLLADPELPKGKIMWLFDRTDMRAVKDALAGHSAFGGNVPSSLFATSTADAIDQYCKDLLENVAPGGGFFLSPGAVIDQAIPENVHAYFNSVRKYAKH